MTMQRRTLTIVALLLFLIPGWFSGTVYAQDAGITEHLGGTIPADITFTDENNNPVSLDGIIHKPTVLMLVYYNCQGVCPMILSGVTDVVERTDAVPGSDYQLLTVSFDPSDTPDRSAEKKKSFLRKKTLANPDSWHYLTGDTASIGRLLRATGFTVIPQGRDFMHPAAIIILSPERKITRYLYGTNYLPFDLKMALIEAQRGQARPTINRVLEFCFSYDPDGRRYTLQVTKIAATIIIFFAVLLFIFLLVRSGRKRRHQAKSGDPKNQL